MPQPSMWVPPELLRFTVQGNPVGQGRLSARGRTSSGRTILTHSNHRALQAWRQIIRGAALTAIAQLNIDWTPIDRPVIVDRWYTMPRPVSKASQRPWPSVTSATNCDIDHLDRALFDALTGAGVVRDDALIVGGAHLKAYPGDWPQCPPAPGVAVVIWYAGHPLHWKGTTDGAS